MLQTCLPKTSRDCQTHKKADVKCYARIFIEMSLFTCTIQWSEILVQPDNPSLQELIKPKNNIRNFFVGVLRCISTA